MVRAFVQDVEGSVEAGKILVIIQVVALNPGFPAVPVKELGGVVCVEELEKSDK